MIQIRIRSASYSKLQSIKSRYSVSFIVVLVVKQNSRESKLDYSNTLNHSGSIVQTISTKVHTQNTIALLVAHFLTHLPNYL